jgi:hypothetical protein
MVWCLVKHRKNFTFTFTIKDSPKYNNMWHYCGHVRERDSRHSSDPNGRVLLPRSSFACLIHNCSCMYESVSKSFRTESITKETKINTSWEATQKVMAAKLTRLTHKIAIQLHVVAESCTICSSRSKRPVRKLLGTPSYMLLLELNCR